MLAGWFNVWFFSKNPFKEDVGIMTTFFIQPSLLIEHRKILIQTDFAIQKETLLILTGLNSDRSVTKRLLFVDF